MNNFTCFALCVSLMACGGSESALHAGLEVRPDRGRGEGETAAADDVVLVLKLAGRTFALKEPWEDRRRPYPAHARVLSEGQGVQWLIGRPRKSDLGEITVVESPQGRAPESCVARVMQEVTLVERCPGNRHWDNRGHGVHFPALEISGCSVPPGALLTGFPGRVQVESANSGELPRADGRVQQAVEIVERRIAQERLGQRVTGTGAAAELDLIEVRSFDTSYVVRDGDVVAVLGNPLVFGPYLRVGGKSFFYVSDGREHEGYLVVGEDGVKHRFASNVPRRNTCAGDVR